MARTATTARFNFEHAIEDVSLLLRQHDDLTGRKGGRPRRELEVLKRSALILVVTAWESYIEDTLREQFMQRLNAATLPSDLRAAFNATAEKWLNSKNPTPIALAEWTGERWKELVRAQFDQQVEGLNTPGSKQVAKLSRLYLGLDVVEHWVWAGTTSASASKKLDDMIQLRGALVHRGRELFDKRQPVRKTDVIRGLELVTKLVECTDRALGVAPRTTLK